MEEGEAAAAEIPDGDGEQLRSKRPKLRNMTNRAREPGTVFTNFTLAEDMFADQFYKDLQIALIDHDCPQTSSLASTLMVALAGGAKSTGKGKRQMEFRSVMMAGLEVLRRHPRDCSKEKLRKYLRTARAYEKRPSYLVGLGMEVAFAFLEAGEEEQAHSLMFADKDARLDAGSRYRVRAASGQLRYHQWLHAWLDNEHRDPKCKVPDGVGYDETIWSRSSRQTQEYWRDAETSLRDAVALQPAATEVAYLLVHLLVCGGRIQPAIDVAVQLQKDAADDADTHALSILMLQASQQTPESLDRALQSYVDLLVVDPASFQAINGFLDLLEHADKVPLPTQVLCMCLHLDAAGEKPASSHVWDKLANVLYGAASTSMRLNDEEGSGAPIPQHWREIHDIFSARKYWAALYFSVGRQSLSSGTAEDEELVTSKAICAAFIAEDGGQYSSQVAKQLLTAGNGKAHDSILQAMAFCTRLADADALSQEDPGELAQYGKHNMKYGTVVQMPKSWWKAFPPYRRKG